MSLQADGNLFDCHYHFGRKKLIIPAKLIFLHTKHRSPISCPELLNGNKHPSYPLPPVHG